MTEPRIEVDARGDGRPASVRSRSRHWITHAGTVRTRRTAFGTPVIVRRVQHFVVFVEYAVNTLSRLTDAERVGVHIDDRRTSGITGAEFRLSHAELVDAAQAIVVDLDRSRRALDVDTMNTAERVGCDLVVGADESKRAAASGDTFATAEPVVHDRVVAPLYEGSPLFDPTHVIVVIVCSKPEARMPVYASVIVFPITVLLRPPISIPTWGRFSIVLFEITFSDPLSKSTG